ncbi:MAG: apolipoprotein N-acyltransferase, partial [Armatimonadota bacterium]
AICCYAPFMMWLRDYSKRPFLAGWVFGLFYGVMNETWLGQFAAKYTGSTFVGCLMVFIIAGVWGCFYGFACWIRTKVAFLGKMYSFIVLIFAMEFARMNVPQLEYPNCPIGEPLVVYPAIAIALRSAYLCLFITLLLNGLLAEIFAKPILTRKTLRVMVVQPIAFVALMLFTPYLMSNLFSDKDANKKIGIRVALGQLGTDLAYSDEDQKPSLIRAAADDLTNQAVAQHAEVLILPEGLAHFDVRPETPFKLLPNMPVIFGAQHGRSPTYQAAYLWDGKGFSHTDKRQLVVMGEQVPFRNVIPWPKDLKLPDGDLINGTERHLLEPKPGVRIGTLICYESMFWKSSQEFATMNADLLAVISLDDWYMGTNGIPRLAICSQWRAVETRKWLVRVGSLGKTMIIDPSGRVVAEIPTGIRKLLIYDL